LRYHLIGVGGTGMGALAGLLKALGHEVRGSDAALYPPMSDQLEALKIPVFKGYDAGNLVWGPDAVVVGNVCRKDHPEVIEAQRRGLRLLSMPAVLADRFLKNRHSVVIAGTHGKTTTTALLADILVRSGRDPSFLVGGVPIEHGRGWRYGQGPEFVIEGDEYDTAFFDKSSKFLHYEPKSVILTSVELDHVDIFASMEEVRDTFRKLVRLIPEDGLLVVCAASSEALAIAQKEARCRVETYAVCPPGVDAALGEYKGKPVTWLAGNLAYTKSGRCHFELWRNGDLVDRYESLLVGDHNVSNVVAAVAVARDLGAAPDDVRRGVARFAGVKRRQEVLGMAQGVFIMDDYAHHPTAVAETLKGLRKRFERRRLIAVYEPRTATSRRRTFQGEFVEAFLHADMLIVGRLFDPSRIPESERFDAERLALEVHQGGVNATCIENVDEIVAKLVDEVRPGDVVVIMSSGAFDGLHSKLIAALGDAVMPAGPTELPRIRKLLDSVGLATDEVPLEQPEIGGENNAVFLFLRNETGMVGCVCLEVYAEDAILRSLAVVEESRGVGYGWMLADAAIQLARYRGVRRVYLLTETASDFFAEKHGFRVVVPSTISPEVADSASFRGCLEGAVTMRLDL